MTAPLRCHEAVERLWAYLDDDLDGVDLDAVEQHLQRCLRCCGELDFARHVRDRLARSQPSLPGDAQQRLEAFIDDLGAGGPAGVGRPT